MRLNPTSERGFTLVEVLVVLAILALVLVGVAELFAISRQTLGVVSTYSNFLGNARLALTPMARDLRTAGFDPTGTNRFGFRDWTPSIAEMAAGAPPSFTAVATATSILFSLDADRNGNVANSGVGDNAEERVGFLRDGNTLVRTTDGTTPAAGLPPVARNVTGLQFAYFDANGTAIPTNLPMTETQRRAIRRIQVTVTFTEVASDVTRTHTVVTDIMSRNL